MTPENFPKNIIRRTLLVISAFCVVFYFVYLSANFRVFRHGLKEFNTVKLGHQRADVIYRLGQPTQVNGPVEQGPWGPSQRVFDVEGPIGGQNRMPSDRKLEDYGEWVYEMAHGPSRLTIAFDTTGYVSSLNWYCNNENPSSWGPVAGIRNGDSEETVLRLGNPTINSIRGTTKTIEFSDIGLAFELVKGKTYMVTVKRPMKGEGAMFWRFAHTIF